MGELIEHESTTDELRVSIEPGLSVLQILQRANVPPSLSQFVVVTVNGTELSQDQYAFLVPRENDQLGIYVRPAGGDDGKQILRLIATIVVAVVAYKIGGALLVANLGAKVGFSAATSQIIASAVIATVGALVINALIPPPSLNLPGSGYETGESYFITGQKNQARPYQLVPVVYGQMKMVGNIASQPEIFSAGDSTLFTTLIDFGLGDSQLLNFRAGDTKLQFFRGQIIQHTNTPAYADATQPELGLAPVPLELLKYPLKDQELSVGLNSDGDEGIANTVPTAVEAVVELYFPQGVAYYDKNGNKQNLGVSFKGEYRRAGTEEWLNWPSDTQGFDNNSHLSFQGGFVDGDNPNPPSAPEITWGVPTSDIVNQTNFEFTVRFGQEVYDVFSDDFVFINAATLEEETRFSFVERFVVEQNREWRYVYRAPFVPDDVTRQFFVSTNLQEFLDAPLPDGVPFPDKEYVSPNFAVKGDYDTPVDPGGPTETDPNLYSRQPGDETYVYIVAQADYNQSFVPGVDEITDMDIWSFEVWRDGVQIARNTGSPYDYAGTFQEGDFKQNFSGNAWTEYYSVKAAYAGTNRSIGKNRFYPEFNPPLSLGSLFSIYGNDVKPGRVSIVIPFPEMGEYEVRVIRVGDTENSDDKNQYFNAAYWTRIASRGYFFDDIDRGRRAVLNLQRFHSMAEIRLEASERLQGDVQSISAVVVSRLRGHNGSEWTQPSNSANPAWIVADLLTGYRAQQLGYPMNGQDCPGYVKEDQLDLATFRAFARHCDEMVAYEYKGETQQRRRYTCDIILANNAPLMETIQNILGMARAALIIGQNGKIQIMMDEDRADQVRQVFTPANSYEFRGSRSFPQLPHALRVEFVSPDLGYQKGETIVYAPGYDFSTATVFEDLKTFGCTNWHMAAQFGMYTLAQMYLRQEEFTLKVAAESLVVQRGDVCEIASDVAALGGAAHLIVEHISADTFVLSEEPNEYEDPYYTIKTNEGVFQGKVLGIVGRTVQLDTGFATVKPEETNVIVIGQQGLVTKKYIIKSIRPLPDFNAELQLVPYDERMYRTDEGEFPEWTPGGDGDPQNPNNGGNARTVNLQGFTYLEYENRQPISVSKLTWDLQTADAQLAEWRIQWSQAGQTARIDVARVTADKRGFEHKYPSNGNEFGAGTYVVTPVMQLGYEGAGDSVFVGKSIDRISPPDIQGFRAVIEPGWKKFFWIRPDAPDIGGYSLYELKDPNGQYGQFDVIIADRIGQPTWDLEYFVAPRDDDYYGPVHYWLICTDTSGNDSEWAYFDGLANGIPTPGLVEPFDFIAQGGVNGARLQWVDLEDPNDLVDFYELRHATNELQQSPNPSTYLGQVAPGIRRFELTDQGYSDVGSWFIRAVDKFSKAGPWNRTSSLEIDYGLTGSYTQEMFYVDRMPWTRCNITFDVLGAEADQIDQFRGILYPRQAEGRAQPLVFFDTTDTSVRECFFELEQLPRGDIYHQGQIVIEGLVNGQFIGIYRAVMEWDLEYDVTGPAAPTDVEVIRDEANELVEVRWTPPTDPDLQYYELKYASRADMEWEDAESLGYRPWNAINATGFEDRPGKYLVRATDTSDNPGQVGAAGLEAVDPPDPGEGWELFQSIQGHFAWLGTLENLYRPADGGSTLLLDESTPVIDGKQTAFFYYDEKTNIPVLSEVRIVSETLRAFEDEAEYGIYMSDWDLLSLVDPLSDGQVLDSNVTLTHEIKYAGGDWQPFGDSVFSFSGEADFRIRLENTVVGGNAGIDRSRILIYTRSDEP